MDEHQREVSAGSHWLNGFHVTPGRNCPLLQLII